MAKLREQIEAGLALVESLEQDVEGLRETNARMTREAAGSERSEALAAMTQKIQEKDKAIAILSRAVRKRDAKLKVLNGGVERLRHQYLALEKQYTSASPTAKLHVLTDAELGRSSD